MFRSRCKDYRDALDKLFELNDFKNHARTDIRNLVKVFVTNLIDDQQSLINIYSNTKVEETRSPRKRILKRKIESHSAQKSCNPLKESKDSKIIKRIDKTERCHTTSFDNTDSQ